MRSYLVFILALALFISNSARTPKVFAYPKNEIFVTATVLEHITYKKEGEAILTATNYYGGLSLLERSSLRIITAKF